MTEPEPRHGVLFAEDGPCLVRVDENCPRMACCAGRVCGYPQEEAERRLDYWQRQASLKERDGGR